MGMTKERLEQIKNFVEQRADVPGRSDTETFFRELIAEVERLQTWEAMTDGPFNEKEWPIPFREEEIAEAREIASTLWSAGPSVQGPLVRCIEKLMELYARGHGERPQRSS